MTDFDWSLPRIGNWSRHVDNRGQERGGGEVQGVCGVIGLLELGSEDWSES